MVLLKKHNSSIHLLRSASFLDFHASTLVVAGEFTLSLFIKCNIEQFHMPLAVKSEVCISVEDDLIGLG